jgi:hypothetical protein
MSRPKFSFAKGLSNQKETLSFMNGHYIILFEKIHKPLNVLTAWYPFDKKMNDYSYLNI